MVNTVPSDYVTGTITLTNGSAAFTGTGTGWLAMMFRQGDMILDLPDAPEYIAIIDEVTTNTAGTLTRPWLGPTLTGAYRMRYQWDAGRVTAMSAFLREELGNGNLQAFAALVGSAGGVPVFIGPGAMEVRPATDFVNGVAYDVQVDTLADRAAFDGQSEGFSVLVSNIGDGRSALYSKASNAVGDWTDPAYITGPVGPLPTITVDTTTTLPPGSSATVTSTPVTGGVELDFGIPAGEGFVSRGTYSGATAYVKGDVVQNNGSSWIAKIATTGNAPPVLPTVSNTWWELLAAAGLNGTGTGDVVGPASATDNGFARFDGTTGKLIKDSAARIANADLADVPTATIKGRVAAGTGVPTDLTAAQIRTLIGSVGIARVRVITGSGTYVPDPDLIFADAWGTGGGGGGGACQGGTTSGAASAGGGSGTTSRRILTKAQIGASQTVTIGPGGSAGSSGPSNGGNGSTTSLGTLLTAPGGVGGGATNGASSSNGVGGDGGATGTGDVSFRGSAGQSGSVSVPGVGVVLPGGGGAPSYWGGGGKAPFGSAGGNGTAPGAGGAGSALFNSSGLVAGGAGANGIIIIIEYCEK